MNHSLKLMGLWVGLMSASLAAADSGEDFDALGGNTVLMERAKALKPDANLSVVQPRTVSRRHRVEIAPEFASTFGGEGYVRTKAFGLNAYYHFNPRFSLGLKYDYAFNDLTPEGEQLVNEARKDYAENPGNPRQGFPDVDYKKDQLLALATWYPIYGKLNLFDQRTVQFDVYTLGGAGQVRLSSGPATTFTAGLGMGFWFNPSVSARLEMRYQRYTAQYFSGARDLDLAVGSMQMGWML